jgi:hypothetical protein
VSESRTLAESGYASCATVERTTYFEVGFFVGASSFDWEAPMRVNTEGEAKLWVHYLNGGDAPKGLEPA